MMLSSPELQMERRDVRSSLSLPAHTSRYSPYSDIHSYDDVQHSAASWKRFSFQEVSAVRTEQSLKRPTSAVWRTSQELVPLDSTGTFHRHVDNHDYKHVDKHENKHEEEESPMERAKTDLYLSNLTRTPRYGLGRHKTYADMLAEMNPDDPFKAEYKPSMKSPKKDKSQEDDKVPQSGKTAKTRNKNKTPLPDETKTTSNESAGQNKSPNKESSSKKEKLEKGLEEKVEVNKEKVELNKKNTSGNASQAPSSSKKSPSKSVAAKSTSKQMNSQNNAKTINQNSEELPSTQRFYSLSSTSTEQLEDKKDMKKEDGKEKTKTKSKLAKAFQHSLASRGSNKPNNDGTQENTAAENIKQNADSRSDKVSLKKSESQSDMNSNNSKSKEEKIDVNPQTSKDKKVAKKNELNEVLTLTDREKTEIRLSLANLSATIERKKKAMTNIDAGASTTLDKENVIKTEEVKSPPSTSFKKKKKPAPALTGVNDNKAPGCFLNPQSVSNHLYCSICGDVFTEPQRAPCGHSFCRKCITDWLKESKTCPEDRKPIYVKQLHHDFILENIIADIMVCCPYRRAGCDHVGPLQQLKGHKDSCKLGPDARPGFHRESKTLPP